MNLNISYDSNTLKSAPSAFFTAVNYAVNLLDATFTNNATVNIEIGYGNFPYDNSVVPALGESIQNNLAYASYAQAVQQLTNQGAPGFNTLPINAPIGGSLVMGSAQEKALGLTGNSSALDGWVGIASNATLQQQTGGSWSFSPTATPGANQYYMVGTLEHEITEVMGRISYLDVAGEYGVMDLYRYAAPGVRQTGTADASYFSTNGGVTNLDSWNNYSIAKGDLGDWAPKAGPTGTLVYAGADAFNAYSNPGVINGLTATDITLMQALGWNQAVATVSTRFVETGDFAGIGQAGLLYVGGGNAVIALPSGAGFSPQAVPNAQMGAEWTPFGGSGDFNGDGKADILWSNNSGQVAIWEMNGAQLAGYGLPAGHMGAEWHVAGIADFNGDGDADILWQSTGGNVALWSMNGTVLSGFGVPSGHMGQEWQVAGVGDFNGDGKADALWVSTSGQVADWLLNGSNLVGFNANVGALGTDWHVAGIGDVTGDKISDVVWVDRNNDVQIWDMAGGGIGQIVYPSGHNGLEWHLDGVADVTGDGRADLVWLNNSGSSQVWQIDGSQVTVVPGSAPVATTAGVGEQGQLDPGAIVTGLYADVLGRSPDPGGFSVWTNALASGWSVEDVRTAFARSPEAQNDLTQLYNQVLDRAPDDVGLSTWTNELAGGATLIGVRSLFAYSSEAQNDLTALFQNALGRTPDMAELAEMQGQLAPPGTTLSDIADGLVTKGPTGFRIATVTDGDLLLSAQKNPEAFDFSGWSFGNDTILGFDPTQDAIRLSHTLAGDFSTVQSRISSVGNGTVIAFDTSRSLTLDNITPRSLTLANFHFV